MHRNFRFYMEELINTTVITIVACSKSDFEKGNQIKVGSGREALRMHVLIMH